ncbi:MAG: hypothetical protein J0L84_02280 [Verrucomicrobia bacterium]|nr:hypothetical protein [Verrucomicrobiota bacterium]
MKRQAHSDAAVRVLAATLSAAATCTNGLPASLPVVSTPNSLATAEAAAHQVTSVGPAVRSPVPRLTEWRKGDERRFRELARREAVGEITLAEARELEELAQARQELMFPRSADQILEEIRRRDAVAKLIQAIHVCAQVLPADRSA